MILRDIFEDTDFNDVFAELRDIYYTERDDDELEKLYNSYNKVFDKLANLQVEFSQENYILNVNQELEWAFDEDDNKYETEEYYWHVNAINQENNLTYGIDFCPWSQLLGYDVVREQISTIGKNIYLANVLYEITYYGFDEDVISDVADGLKELLKESLKEFEDPSNVVWNQITGEIETIEEDIWGDDDEDSD